MQPSQPERPIHRVIDLIAPETQQILNMSVEEARLRVLSGDPQAVSLIHGSFALVVREGEQVCLARSLDRPLRYFLAKEKDGPMLAVADRIDTLRACLEAEGHGGQFHPSYTRMVPAHHVTQLRLIGCPDPNPVYRRFFDPPRAVLPPDLDLLGRTYVEVLTSELRAWVAAIPREAPIGVLFSGGVDSGSVLLGLYRALLEAGLSPARLKAFTLAVDGGGSDLAQARRFLGDLGLDFLLEPIEVPAEAIDPLAAIEVIEDYKQRDVECAAVTLALAAALRDRYPEWQFLVDGDGGDENLKDYPIEENAELTIRSVVNNRMLYHEGWGVEAIKHSLTYSGGLSRGVVRGYAPLSRHGFVGFSPLMRPAVIATSEAIPFAELSQGSHERLYALKGEIVRRGVAQVLGFAMPVFPKRRFQEGAVNGELFASRFGHPPERYRQHFLGLHAPR